MPKVVFAIRLTLASVWLYNGLWLKILAVDPHHLEIMQATLSHSQVDPRLLLRMIGSCETLLAIGIISGLFFRFVSIFQIAVLLVMNIVGGILGGGTIAHPFGLIVSNLPTFMCAAIVAIYGPGAYALSFNRNERS